MSDQSKAYTRSAASDTADESAAISRALAMKRIAIVGASDDPDRPSWGVMGRLLQLGFDCVPVNPTHATVHGRRCYASLAEVPGKVELVNVFRRPDACPQVAREAVAIGAQGLWLQSGITSAESRQIATAAGLVYVENQCLAVAHSLHPGHHR